MVILGFDGGDGGDSIAFVGSHEDDALGRTTKHLDVFEWEFDYLSFFGGKNDVFDFFGD